MKRFLLVLLVSSAAMAGSWADPSEDLFSEASSPALDLVRVTIGMGPDEVTVRLRFSGASPADLEELSGFVDIDADNSPFTGRSSHIEEFGMDPYPFLGVDYYLEFYAYSGLAGLIVVEEGLEWPLMDLPVEIDGDTVTVRIPRDMAGESGIAVDESLSACVLIGNGLGPTDRAPNDDGVLLVEPIPADLDGDGDVDQDDVSIFALCATGPAVGPPAAECSAVDLDDDHDVDQDDFGILQRSITGPG